MGCEVMLIDCEAAMRAPSGNNRILTNPETPWFFLYLCAHPEVSGLYGYPRKISKGPDPQIMSLSLFHHDFRGEQQPLLYRKELFS